MPCAFPLGSGLRCTDLAERTGSRGWITKCLLSPPSSSSRPISVMNFAQACAKRAANANAGFLKEYKVHFRPRNE